MVVADFAVAVVAFAGPAASVAVEPVAVAFPVVCLC